MLQTIPEEKTHIINNTQITRMVRPYITTIKARNMTNLFVRRKSLMYIWIWVSFVALIIVLLGLG